MLKINQKKRNNKRKITGGVKEKEEIKEGDFEVKKSKFNKYTIRKEILIISNDYDGDNSIALFNQINEDLKKIKEEIKEEITEEDLILLINFIYELINILETHLTSSSSYKGDITEEQIKFINIIRNFERKKMEDFMNLVSLIKDILDKIYRYSDKDNLLGLIVEYVYGYKIKSENEFKIKFERFSNQIKNSIKNYLENYSMKYT
jgi:hypothetical protein